MFHIFCHRTGETVEAHDVDRKEWIATGSGTIVVPGSQEEEALKAAFAKANAAPEASPAPVVEAPKAKAAKGNFFEPIIDKEI